MSSAHLEFPGSLWLRGRIAGQMQEQQRQVEGIGEREMVRIVVPKNVTAELR